MAFASVFDAVGFRSQAADIADLVDRGEYHSLKEAAILAVEDAGRVCITRGGAFDNLELPLVRHGASCAPKPEEIRSNSNPSSADIGFWFLWVLGSHLHGVPVHFGCGIWLWTVLGRLGVPEEIAALLGHGRHNGLLVKPDGCWPQTRFAELSDPYWKWMTMRNAYSGWMSADEAADLKASLDSISDEAISDFDISIIPNIDYDNPVVVREIRESVPCEFRMLKNICGLAVDKGYGLFTSTIFWN